MERTLDTVLRSIGNPSIASGMISRSPSPDSANAATSSRHGTQALLARSPSPSVGLSVASGSGGAGPSSGIGGINPNATQNHSSQYASPSASFSGPSHTHANGSGQAPIRPKQQPGSPKLHSLPDNSLNPLGLLAEASLANRRAQQASAGSHGLVARPSSSAAGGSGSAAQGSSGSGSGAGAGASGDSQARETPKVGVASDNYFKPGPMTILPLRRLYIERQVQPEMLSYVSTEEVVTLFNM
jgi:hypothetical protein